MLFKNENAYNKEIARVSAETGIDPHIIKGIIGAESSFNPKSYRYEPHIRDASYGLMQILSKTAKAQGYRPAWYGDTKLKSRLYDPYTNILYGTKHFASLMNKYRNLDDAIASYNMGHPRPASKTTSLIMKLFGQPKAYWRYANQPYVDRVKGYINYFKTGIKPSKDAIDLKMLLPFGLILFGIMAIKK